MTNYTEEESLKALIFRRMESLTKYPVNNDHKLYEKTVLTAQIVGLDPKSVETVAFMFFFATFDGKISNHPLKEKTLLMIGIAKCMFDLWSNEVKKSAEGYDFYYDVVSEHIKDGSITKETADKYFFGINEQYVIRAFIKYVIDNLKE